MLKEVIFAAGFKIQILRAKSSETDCLKLFRLLSSTIIFGTMWLCRKGEHTFIYQKDQAEHSILLFKSSKRTFQILFSHDRKNDESD